MRVDCLDTRSWDAAEDKVIRLVILLLETRAQVLVMNKEGDNNEVKRSNVEVNKEIEVDKENIV